MAKVTLPISFKVRAADSGWVPFEFEAEPLFTGAIQFVTEIYNSGPRNLFSKIASRSSAVAVVNNALNAGDSLEGSCLSGPAIPGVPGEVYGYKIKASWRRFIRYPPWG